LNKYYNQNYAYEEIELILDKIKACVKTDRFSIAVGENRQENICFINHYNINSNKQRKILLDLKIEDFCHTLNNTKVGYEYELLYVFVPRVQLYNVDGEEEMTSIYIKFNLIELGNGNRVVVISFHKPNKTIDYLFK